ALDDPVLDLVTHGALEHTAPPAGVRVRAVLHTAQRVEHRHVRHAPKLGEPRSDPAREPVVAVHDRVLDALALDEPFEVVDERRQVLDDRVLVDAVAWTGVEVDDARTGAERHDARQARLRLAREDVDVDAGAAELAAQLADVELHPADLARAELVERAAVHAEHRDARRPGRLGALGPRNRHRLALYHA